ncbi:MAG: hypothetical protein U0527_02045 [Candidatus Eisenbacteria bacterium]
MLEQGGSRLAAALLLLALSAASAVAMDRPRPAVGVGTARVRFSDDPDRAIEQLLHAWRDGETQPMPATADLADSTQAVLSVLASLFAQLALSPPEELRWDWHQPTSTSHAPRTPAGLLAARWSFFFAERRAARQVEAMIGSGPKRWYEVDLAVRAPLWQEASERASDSFRALRRGKLPHGAPAADTPLLPLSSRRQHELESNPGWARLPWLAFPCEIPTLTAKLKVERASLARFALLDDVLLTYLIQPDRMRLVAAPIPPDSLAARIERVLPYPDWGCRTPPLSDLPEAWRSAAELFRWLLTPAGESIELDRPLWIAPDGLLFALPLESLATRGTRSGAVDRVAVWDRAADVPLALDRQALGYVVDPGVLAPPFPRCARAGADGELSARIIFPSAPASEDAQALCEPDADTVARLLDATEGIAITEHLAASELPESLDTQCTVFFAPTAYLAGGDSTDGEPRFAVHLGETDALDTTATLGAWLDARGLRDRSLGRWAAFPEGPAELQLGEQRRGALVLALPALAAEWGGSDALVQALWNAGEANWIPLVSLFANPAGPSFELFQSERVRLRGLTLPAGPGHRLSLAHPYFSCALRWWRSSPRWGEERP